nr:ABC transporter substrate-binding protein [Brucella pseudogrignonensis]
MIRYGDFEGGVFPWSRPFVRNPKPIFVNPELDFEEIALLKPDLILCVYSGVSEHEYRRLSTIAPTVPFRSAPWSATWQEVTEMTGRALGLRERSSELICQTNHLLEKLAASEPVLAGKTFVFGSYGMGSGELGVYLPTDPRIANLMALGLRPAPVVEKLAKTRPHRWSGGLSLEVVTDMDTDILIMWYGNAAIRNDAETNKLFQKISAFAKKSYIAFDRPEEFWAVSAPTVLSIPYFFPQFTPRLAQCARLSER